MAAFERTRVRERDPQDANTYERNMRVQLAFRERSLTGKIVLKGSERPLEQSRQGFLQFFNSREAITDTALKDWTVFLHDIRRHSGKHRHQGGLAIFVLEGEGYTVVNGERIDWEAGDLILLPIMPEGREHQHFNRHADKPCKWMAFIYKPMHDEGGSHIQPQREIDHVAGLPGVAHAVEQGVAATLPDVDHLAALELQPSAPPAGADLLHKERHRLDGGIVQQRVEIPAHLPKRVPLPGQR